MLNFLLLYYGTKQLSCCCRSGLAPLSYGYSGHPIDVLGRYLE
jgi:hypothetical protein